jgi:SOS response regulatory protein OraA/RecX
MPARSSALESAVQALARRDLSAEGLAAWLERRGVAEDERAEVVAALLDAGYLNDARVAAERVRRLAERGYGDAAIRYDLERKGIGEELVERAIGGLAPERERAGELARRYGGGVRALRTLERKGFTQEALESLSSEEIAESA